MKHGFLNKILFLGLAALSGCGIFSPRDEFENPSDKSSTKDPFNFSSLLQGTAFRFNNSANLNEIFSDKFVYQDINSGEHIRNSKDRLISRLEQLEIDSVVWKKGDGDRRIQGDSVIINNYEYSVYVPGMVDTVAFSGLSNFSIVKIDLSWYIVHWVDMPSSEANSFFAPLD